MPRLIIKISHDFGSANHVIPMYATSDPHKVNCEIQWAFMLPKCIDSREIHLTVRPDSEAPAAENDCLLKEKFLFLKMP